jgi:hypothetical protein
MTPTYWLRQRAETITLSTAKGNPLNADLIARVTVSAISIRNQLFRHTMK